MRVYLDTSVVVPLFLPDIFAGRAKAYFSVGSTDAVISDFATVEFAAVVGTRFRTRSLTEPQCRTAFSAFDAWTAQYAAWTAIEPSDLRHAETTIRRLDLPLRTADTIHIAVAQRLGAELATFDRRMADCARAVGLPIAAL